MSDDTQAKVIHSAVRALLRAAGDDPDREGLRDTPMRVAKAYSEWFSGYDKDPADVFRMFEDGALGCDEMIVVANNPVMSHCEHHAAAFWGLAHIGYLPQNRILGLSKFARLVDIFARRLQVQERLTNQIADAIQLHLKPRGVAVLLECRHLCIESRGVRVRGSVTTTSALRGFMKEPNPRSEFLSLVLAASKAKDGL